MRNFKKGVFMKIVLLVLGVLFVLGCSMSNVTVPYSFSPSTVMYSNQVNANFDTLKNAINRNKDSLVYRFTRSGGSISTDTIKNVSDNGLYIRQVGDGFLKITTPTTFSGERVTFLDGLYSAGEIASNYITAYRKIYADSIMLSGSYPAYLQTNTIFADSVHIANDAWLQNAYVNFGLTVDGNTSLQATTIHENLTVTNTANADSINVSNGAWLQQAYVNFGLTVDGNTNLEATSVHSGLTVTGDTRTDRIRIGTPTNYIDSIKVKTGGPSDTLKIYLDGNSTPFRLAR